MSTPYYPLLPIANRPNLTILMMSSPRPTDARGGGYMLLANLEHTNRALSIASDMVVVFDGLKGRHTYNSQNIQSAYRDKIRYVIDSEWKGERGCTRGVVACCGSDTSSHDGITNVASVCDARRPEGHGFNRSASTSARDHAPYASTSNCGQCAFSTGCANKTRRKLFMLCQL